MAKLSQALIKEIRKNAAINALPFNFSKLDEETFEEAMREWQKECSMNPDERDARDIGIVQRRIAGAISSGNKTGPDFSDLSIAAQAFAQIEWGKRRAMVTDERFLRNKAITLVTAALTRGGKKPALEDYPQDIREEAHAMWERKLAGRIPLEMEIRRAKERVRTALKNGLGEPDFSDLSAEAVAEGKKLWAEKQGNRAAKEMEKRRAEMVVYPHAKKGKKPALQCFSEEAREAGLKKWTNLCEKNKKTSISDEDQISEEAKGHQQEREFEVVVPPRLEELPAQAGPLVDVDSGRRAELSNARAYSEQQRFSFTGGYTAQARFPFVGGFQDHAGFSFVDGSQRQTGFQFGSGPQGPAGLPLVGGYFGQPTLPVIGAAPRQIEPQVMPSLRDRNPSIRGNPFSFFSGAPTYYNGPDDRPAEKTYPTFTNGAWSSD